MALVSVGFRLSLQVSEPINSVEEKPTAGSWQLAVGGNKNGRTNLKGWGESRIENHGQLGKWGQPVFTTCMR